MHRSGKAARGARATGPLVIPAARTMEDWTRTAQLCSGWARENAMKRAVTAQEDYIEYLLAQADSNVVPIPFFDERTGTWRAI